MAKKLMNQSLMNQTSTELSLERATSKQKIFKHNYSYWSQRQNQVYIGYLQQNQHIMTDYKTKRKTRVFLQISKLIGTRTSIQVKSHHQKLLKQYKSLDNILTYFMNKTLECKDDLKLQPKDQPLDQSENNLKIQPTQNLLTENNVEMKDLNWIQKIWADKQLQFVVDQEDIFDYQAWAYQL